MPCGQLDASKRALRADRQSGNGQWTPASEPNRPLRGFSYNLVDRLMRTLFLVFGACVLSGCCSAPKQVALEADISVLVKPGMQLNDAVASLSTAGFTCDSRAMALPASYAEEARLLLPA